MSDRKIIDQAAAEELFSRQVTSVDEFIKDLNDNYVLDYSTIVIAMTAAAVQAANVVNNGPTGGITGYQASWVMWMFIQRFMSKGGPMTLLEYNHMLYPQYEHEFDRKITKETHEWLIAQAKAHLASDEPASTHVRAHWLKIAEGEIPFGFTVKD